MYAAANARVTSYQIRHWIELFVSCHSTSQHSIRAKPQQRDTQFYQSRLLMRLIYFFNWFNIKMVLKTQNELLVYVQGTTHVRLERSIFTIYGWFWFHKAYFFTKQRINCVRFNTVLCHHVTISIDQNTRQWKTLREVNTLSSMLFSMCFLWFFVCLFIFKIEMTGKNNNNNSIIQNKEKF